MAKLLILWALSFLVVAPAAGESWDDIRRLGPGEKVKIIDGSAHELKGEFISVTADAISVRTKNGETSVARTQVRRVQVRSGARRLRNTLIGAAIGVAIAVAVDQTLGTRLRNESGDGGQAITYGVSIAGLAGLGGAFPSYRTVYKAP